MLNTKETLTFPQSKFVFVTTNSPIFQISRVTLARGLSRATKILVLTPILLEPLALAKAMRCNGVHCFYVLGSIPFSLPTAFIYSLSQREITLPFLVLSGPSSEFSSRRESLLSPGESPAGSPLKGSCQSSTCCRAPAFQNCSAHISLPHVSCLLSYCVCISAGRWAAGGKTCPTYRVLTLGVCRAVSHKGGAQEVSVYMNRCLDLQKGHDVCYSSVMGMRRKLTLEIKVTFQESRFKCPLNPAFYPIYFNGLLMGGSVDCWTEVKRTANSMPWKRMALAADTLVPCRSCSLPCWPSGC